MNCMGQFLPVFKDNKATAIFYRILVTLRHQLFWEVASAIRRYAHVTVPKIEMSNCSI
jgi:hypothetical protein